MISLAKRVKWRFAMQNNYHEVISKCRTPSVKNSLCKQQRELHSFITRKPGISNKHKSQTFKEYFRNRCHHECEKNISTCAPLLSSAGAAEDDDNLALGDSLDAAEEFEDASFDPSMGMEVTDEEHLSHLRVKLYPLKKEEPEISKTLKGLYESGSIQQVFDIVEEHSAKSEDGTINYKVASQALITIWDLQKLIFKIGPNFNPERDYFDRPTFIDKVGQHPTFLEKIVKPIVDNHDKLDDEPLVASLFCLIKMKYNARFGECGELLEECLRRRETLSLPSLSRLCVCMRNESTFGSIVMGQFFPLLWKYIDSMSEDLEVRLVAIALKNSWRLVSDTVVDKFTSKVDSLKDDFGKWETVTLCKIFLVLLVSRYQGTGTQSKHVFDLVGNALVPRIPTMDFMDLLSLQRFLELGHVQPYVLTQALIKRMTRVVQEGVSSSLRPRLDLMGSIAPFLKSVYQRKQLRKMLKDYLDQHSFELASGILFNLLRWSKTRDTTLYNQFWKRAADFVAEIEAAKDVDRRILKMGKDYVNFCHGLNFTYKNLDFETTMKRYLYMLIDNYIRGTQPCLIYPGDFSKAFSFLIGSASLTDPIFYDMELMRTLDDFGPQFRSTDVQTLSRGLEAVIFNLFYSRNPSPKYYNRVLEISAILEEQCSRLMETEESLAFVDLMALHKAALVTRKVKGDAPLLQQTIESAMKKEVQEDRVVRDLSQNLLIGANYYPEANQLMKDYLVANKHKLINPEIIEKFVNLAFLTGWDVPDGNEIWESCSQRITEGWESLTFHGLLQTALGLCYYRHLSKELVEKIFSLEFLDQMDAELTSAYNANQYTLRLRKAMMELNRAVCIDMPDMNLPWFHDKFCEGFIANSPSAQEDYLHKEVKQVLAGIVGDHTAVQCNSFSPYYYNLDFLIEFDEKDRPIRKHRQTSGLFQKFKITADLEEAKRKVAVLILSTKSFTKNIRNLKGPHRLRRRHLEMLGYDVVEVDPVYWNSMFMSEHAMRQTFLESKLYANVAS